MNYRFALRNYSGDPTRFFQVEEVAVADAATTDTTPSHLVFIVDCSGSMYYDISDIRPMIEKLLAVEEFHNANMLTTLISYASSGDVVTHFSRVPVEEVMSGSSPHVDKIRRLRTRGLTCISQSLREALSHVRDTETTCVSLHSDGYANDRSPSTEKREIAAVIAEFQKRSNVFINTVAYRNWSDFQTLSWIANECSGSCLQASSVRQVFQSLHDTSKLLTGSMAPATVSEIGEADLQVFVSGSAQKVLGSTEDLSIRGLAADDDKTVYRFTEVSSDQFNASTSPECGDNNVSTQPVYAFTRAQIAMGNINAAKFATVTSRNDTLLRGHYRALTGPDIASFASAVEEFIYGDPDYIRSSGYGLSEDRPSVLNVVDLLSNHTRDFRVNMKALRDSYVRHSLRRVPGYWEDGEIKELDLKTVSRGDTNFLHVSKFEVNRANATINMLVTRPINLIRTKSGEVINEVKGIPLDLTSFNNYTVVGDGEVTVPVLPIRISSKRLWAKLTALDVIDEGNGFDPNQTYEIELGQLPLIDFDQTFSIPEGTFEDLAELTAVSKFLSGLTKGASTDYTAEQVSALKAHYLSTKLYVNFPTVNEYEDLNTALETGVVDVRNSYKVAFGSTDITSLGKLHSGNKCFARFFSVTVSGNKQKKPLLPMVMDGTFQVDWKTLSARTKLTAVDDLMKPIFADLLGMTDEYDSGAAVRALGRAGVEASRVLDVTARRVMRGDRAVEVLTEASNKVDAAIARIYRHNVIPLAFFVGATGLVPDELGATMMDSEAFTSAFPDTKVTKNEKEGSFFVAGDHALTVFVEAKKFSTGIQAPS